MDGLNDQFLPDNTRKLWSIIRAPAVSPVFSGFVLVGGTALSLRMGHRISEDLDFIWPHNLPGHHESLPRQKIDRAIFHLQKDCGLSIEKISHPAEEDDFINDGLNLDDFHQDYLIGGTKVTFFNANTEASIVLNNETDAGADAPLRVATAREVFLLKSLVMLERTKTRDYFDLYTLLKKDSTLLSDADAVLFHSGTMNAWDVFTERLCHLPVQKEDEGYHQMLVSKEQPSLDDMRAFFRDRIAQYKATPNLERIAQREAAKAHEPRLVATLKADRERYDVTINEKGFGKMAVLLGDNNKQIMPLAFAPGTCSVSGNKRKPCLRAFAQFDGCARDVMLFPDAGNKNILAIFAEHRPGQKRRPLGVAEILKPNKAAQERGLPKGTVDYLKKTLGVDINAQQKNKKGPEIE